VNGSVEDELGLAALAVGVVPDVGLLASLEGATPLLAFFSDFGRGAFWL
jgi:hypothetical protein